MARNVKPLTFTEVNKAKPKEKEYTLSDGQGLMLSIRPSGSKVWLFKYQKPFTKKRTNISFGSFPEISIADARKLRLEALTLLAKQIAPREHKQQQTQGKLAELEHTFEKISESWMTVKNLPFLRTMPRISGVHLNYMYSPSWGNYLSANLRQLKPSTLLNQLQQRAL